MSKTPRLIALAVACAVAGPAWGAPPPTGLDVDHYRLENGLEVVLHEDRSSPTVLVYVWFHVGSKDERPGRTGFAHLFEHLMFKGSKHVPDGVFDELLESAGGWSNGTTSSDRTNYFEQLPSHQLELALYLEADRLAGLWDTMSQAKLDNQRDVVKNERRQSYENRPYGMAEIAVQQALWPAGHGNHNLTIGTMEDLSAASLADVEAFYRRYYVPNNATLVIAGDIDKAATRTLVRRYFGWIPKRADPPHVTLQSPVNPLARSVDLRTSDRVQARKLIMAWRSPTPLTRASRDLEVAAQILAGGKSSRLYEELVYRERLADSVVAYQYGQMLGGEFRIQVILKPGASEDRVRAIIDRHLGAMARTPVPAGELARALRVLEVDGLQRLESLIARADQLAEYAAYRKDPNFFAEDLALLRSTRATGVAGAVAAWLGTGNRVIMTVVPKKGGAR